MEPLLSLDDQPLLTALRTHADALTDAAESVNRAGRLTEPVMRILADTNTFDCLFPAGLGGAALRLDHQTDLIREVAYRDASIGWCVSILIDGGFFAGTVDQAVAREIYPSAGLPTATTTFPLGTAVSQPGGRLRMNGRWMFASGVQNSDYVVLGFKTETPSGEALLDTDDEPLIRWAWMPTKSVVVESQWDALGLSGTGSVEISVENQDIDERHVIDYTRVPQGDLALPPGSRYRAFLAAKGVGVPLGIARRAYDEYRAQITGSTRIGARESVAVSRSEALITAAESIVTNLYSEISDRVWSDERLSAADEGRLNSSMPIIGDLCYQAVDIIMDAVGARSVLHHYIFERLFRDISTIRRHLVYQQNYYRVGGDLLLGLAAGGKWK